MVDETAESSQKGDLESSHKPISIDNSSTSDLFSESISKAIDAFGSSTWKPASKRFEISDASSDLLLKYRNEIGELQKDHPEVVGATVYGSQVKGKATSESDLDSFVFVDTDALEGRSYEEFLSDTGRKFKEKLAVTLNLDASKLKDIKFSSISKADIDKQVDDSIQFYRDLEGYQTGKSEYPQQSPLYLGDLFHMQVGKGLDPYRAYILDRFAIAGDAGENASKLVIGSTFGWESDRDRGEIREPNNIAEAKKYFKLVNVQPKYKLDGLEANLEELSEDNR